MIGRTMLFNPFTGTPRHPDDIKSDPAGVLIRDGEEPLRAALPPVVVAADYAKAVSELAERQGMTDDQVLRAAIRLYQAERNGSVEVIHKRDSMLAAPAVAEPKEQHSDDVFADEFAAAMKEKLAQARAKGRGGWDTCSQEDLSRMLREHVEKGDPRDVANFCLFLWKLGYGIATPARLAGAAQGEAKQASIYAAVDDVTAACREYIASGDAVRHGPLLPGALERCSKAEAALLAVVTQPLPTANPQAPAATQPESLQRRVQPWMLACFGAEIASDKIERNHRFLEEALELVQACGCTQSEAHQLVDYTFGRPVGEPHQEAGGVMITLAALCLANGLDMHAAAEAELARIWTKVDQIRAKHAAKPKHSPLPEAASLPVAVAAEVGQGNDLDDERCGPVTLASELRFRHEHDMVHLPGYAGSLLCNRTLAALATQPAQPLSDERVTEIYSSWLDAPSTSYNDLVRSVERALGIGIQPLNEGVWREVR